VKKLILPILLLLLGTGVGVGVGLFLLPPAAADGSQDVEASEACAAPAETGDGEHGAEAAPLHDTPSAFVPLGSQFVVPLLEDESVTALVVLSVSLEVAEGQEETALAAEPRLRDAFLQVLFDHANTGGFAGTFTATEPMRSLRLALNAAAQEVLGEAARNVLIVDIVRQDV
jgi:flagellar FliL protein